MGQCTTKCFAKDDNEIAQKINKQQEVTTPKSKFYTFTTDDKKKIIRLQAYVRGYLVRKNHQKSQKYERSSNQKISHFSTLLQDQIITAQNKSLINFANIQNPKSSLHNPNNTQIVGDIDISVSSPQKGKKQRAYMEKIEQKSLSKTEYFDLNRSSSLKSKNSKFTSKSTVKKKIIDCTQNNLQQEDNNSLLLQSFCFQPVNLDDFQKITIQSQGFSPFLTMINGDQYEGTWLNGKANGFGKYFFQDGTSVTATWVDNVPQGQGTYSHPNGDFFIGNWKDGRADGFGQYKYADGGSYQGQWQNDKPNGVGKEILADESEYEGQFLNGQRQGEGELKLPDGSRFRGEFFKNELQGFGVYLWADGRQYEGKWYQSQKHGKGQMKWPDGRIYDGEYENDKKSGYGVFQWPDGRLFKGSWKQGLQNGDGEFFYTNGTSKKGYWLLGKLLK